MMMTTKKGDKMFDQLMVLRFENLGCLWLRIDLKKHGG